MTQEEKKLLIKDICARLPYNVMVGYESYIYVLSEINPACKDVDYIAVRIQNVEKLTCAKNVMIENIKPYLRSMSSMTAEEKEEYEMLQVYPGFKTNHTDLTDLYDWLNEKKFDYRGLIEKGLALEAPSYMYKTE